MISRFFVSIVVSACCAMAAPPLTTIQDLLYKADGTRFSGTLTITWKSFEAADTSAIVMQSSTVRVQDGNLRVQLVPTASVTPAVFYTVLYNSDGRVQFRETWSVPSSAQPVRLRDVRVVVTSSGGGGGTGTGGGGNTGQTGAIQESDVEGLVQDLDARPIKGPGLAPDRVAFVNSTGQIESVSGQASDCVRVDGSAGPCGAASLSFVDREELNGVIDGSNTSFTLNSTPDPANSLAIYRNGLLQKLETDYTATGRQIEFLENSVPQDGDILLASYRLTGFSSGTTPVYSAPQVICSGVGGNTTVSSLTSLGVCTIPAGLLLPGNRVEIQFDFEHTGSAGGFSIEARWGNAAFLHRDIAASEALASGRVSGGLSASGAQLAAQSWGSGLAFLAGVNTSAVNYTSGLTIELLGSVTNVSDTLTLRNFSVVRLP